MGNRENLNNSTHLAKQYRKGKAVNDDPADVRGALHAVLHRGCASPGDS